MSKQTFGERLAALRAQQHAHLASHHKVEESPLARAISLEVSPQEPSELEETSPSEIGNFGNVILNEAQSSAVRMAVEGKSFVLTGAAGTGKTTTQAAVVQGLESLNQFQIHDFKYLGNAPSIAVVAFTKVAVRNIQKALKKNPLTSKYSKHCMTIHTLLEFAPEYVDKFNGEGDAVTTRIFVPHRHSGNPLQITHLIIEEASMVGLDLWKQLYDALQPGVQIIYLGDINQLPPVFGKSIMSYALCKLPVIELTHVYRQALESPIIANAHRVLQGEMILASEDGRFTIVEGASKYKVGQERMSIAMGQMLEKLHEIGDYSEHSDIILIPFNKQAMGTKAMNSRIATFLGRKRNAVVHNVKAGFNEWWLAIGDKVLVEKQAMWITNIQENPKYIGKPTAPPGLYTRDGVLYHGGDLDLDFSSPSEGGELTLAEYENFSMDNIEEDAGKRSASHIVTVSTRNPALIDEGEGEEEVLENELLTAGDFRDEVFQFGYCMSIHKSQGSEWRKVFIILHYDFATMLNRELMYTAITRAREEVVLCAKRDLIEASIKRQRIAGVGLAEKILNFNGGALADLDSIPVVKLDWDDISALIKESAVEETTDETLV